jgi:hypothetical protein
MQLTSFSLIRKGMAMGNEARFIKGKNNPNCN